MTIKMRDDEHAVKYLNKKVNPNDNYVRFLKSQ